MARSLSNALVRGVRAAWRGARAVDDVRVGRARLHFLHIGKTGGTAVKAAFGRSDVVTATHRLILHGHGVSLADVPDGEHAVFVVRDPVSRFVSGFNSRLRRGRPRYDMPWSPDEAAAFEAFPTADALARALGEPPRREQAEAAMWSIRHVCEPLTAYLGTADEMDLGRIALVGCVDTLPAFTTALARSMGAAPVRLPDDPVAAHRALPDAVTGLSPEGTANVRRWYDGDFAVIAALRQTGVLR